MCFLWLFPTIVVVCSVRRSLRWNCCLSSTLSGIWSHRKKKVTTTHWRTLLYTSLNMLELMQMSYPQLMCTLLLCSVAFHHPRRVPSTPTECHCLHCITSAFKTLFTRPTELFHFPVHVVIRETNAKMFLVWPKPKSYKWADLGLGWWIWSHSSHEIHVWCSPTSPRIETKIIPFKLLC